MTAVLDVSAIIDLLLRSDHGQRVRLLLSTLDASELSTVAHLHAEVFSGLARHARAGALAEEEVAELLRRLDRLSVTRLPITGELLDVAWSLRHNIAARDALYVAAARLLQGQLIPTDGRLARAVPELVLGRHGDDL